MILSVEVFGSASRNANSSGTMYSGSCPAQYCLSAMIEIRPPCFVERNARTRTPSSFASATTAETLEWLRTGDITLVVTTPETDVVHTDVDYGGRVAVAVGSEKHGADDALLEAATHRVRIPMHGRANSLNVSVAAAVVLYEVVRQRS